MDTTTVTTQPTLRRIESQFTPRRTAFFDWHTGRFVCDGETFMFQPHLGISGLLVFCLSKRIRQLYITGGAKAADVPGYLPGDADAVVSYWRAPLVLGWEIVNSHREPWRYSYRHDGDGRIIDIAMASSWFGSETDAALCASAWGLLNAELRRKFDSKATLLTTPGRTGMDLLQRSLPRGCSYPAMPDELQEILRHNIPQGHIEQPGLYPNQEMPGVYVLDARFMYASAVRWLPIGPITWDREQDYIPYRKAVYQVTARVPFSWEHIGLVGMWDKEAGHTVWPRTPGMHIQAWVTGAELAVIYSAGWDVWIHQRVLYATDDTPGKDPARDWIDTLRLLREQAEAKNVLPWRIMPTGVPELISAASRHLVLDTVGYWSRTSRPTQHLVPHASAHLIPANAVSLWPTAQGISYVLPEQLDKATASFYHPEWSCQVWGSCRAKLHKKALTLPARHIMWLRHDSIVLDYDPQVEDTGKIGGWRIKAAIPNTTEPLLTEQEYRRYMLAQKGTDRLQ